MLLIDHSLYVNAPISLTYNHWTRYTEFPHFMQGVKIVKRPSWTRLLWQAEYAGEMETWESRIITRIPNECVAWESVNHRTNHMCFEFFSIAPDMTLIKLHAEYQTQNMMEDIGMSLGVVSHRLHGDLVRAQNMIEGRNFLPRTILTALN